MNDSPPAIPTAPVPPIRTGFLGGLFGNRKLLVSTLGLLVAFCVPLYQLVLLALDQDLYSHVILVPFISLYLVWMKRPELPAPSRPDHRLAVAPFIAGVTLLALRFVLAPGPEDALVLTTLALVLLFWGFCTLFVGRQTIWALAFPLGFLVFMAPFPSAVIQWIESTLQHRSADAAYMFFSVAGTTMFREDTFFQLPGMKLFVAPECSGIRSTLALFITSLLAGYIFLRSPAKRAVLALVVIPLAIFRNGLRIFVIGELCVRIGPEMIDSFIHRHGGPIFFALSLLPFSLVLWWLIKSERHSARVP
jgi:exosortase C (VPDSG-CTERM-specific)